MTIAVILSTYGDCKVWDRFAHRAELSIKAQTRQPDELLRFHGSSLQEARNLPAFASKCEWIVYVDADDEIDPRYLEAMLSGQGDWRVPYIQRVRQGVAGQVGPLKPPGASLYERNHIPIGAMIRRELFVAVGGFEDWPIYEDWHLWMKLEAAGARWCWCPEAIYKIHWRDGSRNKDVPLRATTLAKIRESIHSKLVPGDSTKTQGWLRRHELDELPYLESPDGVR